MMRLRALWYQIRWYLFGTATVTLWTDKKVPYTKKAKRDGDVWIVYFGRFDTTLFPDGHCISVGHNPERIAKWYIVVGKVRFSKDFVESYDYVRAIK